jgi:peroxiredoxin
MTRWCIFALAVLIPTAASLGQLGGKKDKDIRIEGKLTSTDPRDKIRNTASQIHAIPMKAGNVYTIDMVSSEFDSFLRLEDNAGKQLAEDDDSGGNLNARIIFPCRKDGEYKVICCAFAESGVGNYVLTIKSSTDTAKYTTAHEVLIGKAAPDFQSDVTINGKAAKLSDFKGKVLLLEFVDLRLEECVAALTRQRDLLKKFKAEGLAVATVAAYQFEIGQKVAFDKASGRLTKSDKGDKTTEQAALKALLGHHKIDHPLLVLSKDEALKAFDNYAVNGVPLSVLIDRNGMVQSFHVGHAKDAAVLETVIKKWLAAAK